LPLCEAVMVHVPGFTVVAVDPDTVHTRCVFEVNDTGSPEGFAFAVRGTRAWTWASFGGSKVIVCPFFVTVNDRFTGGAGAQISLPSWVAVMVQVPAFTAVAVESATVHTSVVLEVNVTGSSEGVARGSCSGTRVSTGLSGGRVKVIVCGFLSGGVTVNDCLTGVAAAQVSSPSWVAVMVQVPGVTVVAVKPDVTVPDTVHTRSVLEVNETCSPDGMAFAVRGTRVWAGVLGSGSNVICCPFFVTVNDCVTSGAGAQMPFPLWVAVTVQVPGVTVVAVNPDVTVPDTVHTPWVPEVNETCSFELAVAVRGTCVWTGVSGGGSKVIVCPSFTANLRCT
jgi:uncharacterized protein (DUF983 family)